MERENVRRGGMSGKVNEPRMFLYLDPTAGAPARSWDIQRLLERSEDQGGGTWYVCRTCGQRVTRASARREVGGASEHERVNPAGIAFRFGCFRIAPGCWSTGIPTAEHSWFVGYLWQFSLCRGCRGHLGWTFVGAGDRFFALILERLAEDRDDERGRA